LGRHVVEVMAVPGRLRALVHRVVIWDAQAADDLAPGDLILAIGMSDRSAQFSTLLDHASSRRAAGVVIKAPIRGDWVQFAAERSELAVLVVSQAKTWDWLHAVLRTALLGPSGLGSPDDISSPADLFTLANAAASGLDGPVEIDDSDLRVLAYSTLGHELDDLRTASILSRAAPADAADWLRRSGALQRIRQSRRPVRITPPGSRPRLAIAVRAGIEILGYIWVTESGERFGASHEDELAATARLAAAELLRGRSAGDTATRAREVLLRGVIDGTGSPEALAETLDLPVAGGFRLLAVMAAGPGGLGQADRLYLRELVAKRAEVAADCCTTTSIGPRIYVLVPTVGLSLAVTKKLGHDVAGRVASHLRQGLLVAIGDEFDSLVGLAPARRAVDRVLSLVTADGDGAGDQGRVVLEEDLRPQMVLHELAELLRGRPHLLRGRLARLDESDRTQHTVYIPTLQAYFDASGDMVKAAQLLFVHRNTLRYRLRRIQDVCGLDLESPEERLVAELQLRVGFT
jgi:PucR C-terminal helix-turn-helix domain